MGAPAEIFVEGGEGKRKKGHPAHAEKGPHKKKKGPHNYGEKNLPTCEKQYQKRAPSPHIAKISFRFSGDERLYLPPHPLLINYIIIILLNT